MSDRTLIEWTDATWNVINGCSVVSPGCTNCYAMRLAGTRLKNHPTRVGLTQPSAGGPVWNGQVRLNEKILRAPLSWRSPRRIFVCAHGDLFHEAVPDEWIWQVFQIIGACPRHQFQILTKRPERMRAWLDDCFSPRIKNVSFGVSAEDQTRLVERASALENMAIGGARWLSLEPLLGPVDLVKLKQTVRQSIDWIVVGGESGPGARPCDPEWIYRIVWQTAHFNIPVFVKQLGKNVPGLNLKHPKGGDPAEWPSELNVRQWPQPKGVLHAH